MNVLGVCAGLAGLELGLQIAEPATRPVCFVESDPFAQRILWERYGVPVWDDVTTFDPEPWAGVVDCVTAGFPCQPWSVSGHRLGVTDPRWIWPSIFQTIRALRARYVFLENVPGVLRGGAQLVLKDLASLGAAIAWGMFPCSKLGAAHVRNRWFALAYFDGPGPPVWDTQAQRCGKAGEEPHPCPFMCDIHGDEETLCHCCPDCEHECAMDI